METLKKKILVVENQDSGNHIENLLKGLEFYIYRSTTIPEALSSLLQENIDLVVLEGSDTETNTLKLCKIIKSHKELKDIPVIFITKNNDKKIIIKAYEVGADDYIIMPDNESEIIDKIELRLLLKDKQDNIVSKFRQNQKDLRILNFEMDTLKKEFIALRNKHVKPDNKSLQNLEIELIKNKFLRILIQELRTPVSAIIGFTDILADDEINTENQTVMKPICGASQKTKELLDTALIVTEINTQTSGNNMRPYKLSNLIEYAVNDNVDLIRKKDIHVCYPQDLEITEIVIDPGLIKEVLRIFILNAIKYSPENGDIKIEIHESVDRIELHIQDSGNGFTEKDLSEISSFLQSPEMIKNSDWSGIRFAIAKFIMSLHNAQIMIENRENGGSLAKLIFPVNNAKREALHQLLSQLN